MKACFDAIISTIDIIRNNGALERYFRLEGGRVKAVPLFLNFPRIDKKIGKIRLYCLRLSDNTLIIGNGGVTTFRKYEDDTCMNEIVVRLRDIDRKIQRFVKEANTDLEDYEALKLIIESIIL